MNKEEYEFLKKYQSVMESLTHFNDYKIPYEETLKDFYLQNYSDIMYKYIYKSANRKQLLNYIFALGLEEFSKKLKIITQKSDSYNINELVQNNILSIKINSRWDIIPVNDVVISNVSVETFGIDYGTPETLEPWNYNDWVYQTYGIDLTQYQN